MTHRFNKCFAIIVLFLLFAVQAGAAPEEVPDPGAVTGEQDTVAPFSFDEIWFYRDGTRIIPEIGKRWLTVVFKPGYDAVSIQEKAKAVVDSHDRLITYLYDPNLAVDACFFMMRYNLKLEDIGQLINQLTQDDAVAYVHPTLVLNHKTFAFFNFFQMEWKTGIDTVQRESLLSATHVVFDEQENRYAVDVAALAFFKAIDLLAEDIRVRRVTPYLVEIKQSISTALSLSMNGGNIGDSIPFALTVIFSDRVSIDPSSFATLNLRPPNLQKELFECTFDPYDYAKAVTKSPIVITGRVKFYAPGEYTIPAVTISYTCPSCSDSGVRSIDTNPVTFRVSSIIPADQPDNRLIVPTVPVNPEYRLGALHRQNLHLWLAIICFAGLVPCVAGVRYLRRKSAVEQDRLQEPKEEDLLAEQLRTLLHATPVAPHWRYLGEIGTLLRQYLMVLYGIDAKYQGGSGKQFMGTIGAHIPEEVVGSLRSIFTAIDNSVSLESEQNPGIDLLQREILKVVDLTAHNTAAQG
jgi:hypothetical protein